MKRVNKWFYFILLSIVLCVCAITIFVLFSNADTVYAANETRVMVYGTTINEITGASYRSIEGSILNYEYTGGVYKLGEANLSSPHPRYNIDYYYKNGTYTHFKVYDGSDNQIGIYIGSDNYYYTTVEPEYAEFYNDVYTVTYYNLYDGQNHSNNPNYIDASSGTITLHEPTRSGYKFLGWYSNSAMTKYVSSIDRSTVTANVSLYAKWTEYIDLPVTYTTTDHYTVDEQTVGHIYAYYNDYTYYYENLSSVSNMVSGHSAYTVYNTSSSALSPSIFEGQYCTSSSSGTPSYIKIDTDPFYSVGYVLNGGEVPSGNSLYNYYYSRADLAADPIKPVKDGYVFIGWFLDSGLTSTMYSSSFEPHDMTVYAKWTQLYSINASYTHTDFFNLYVDYVETIQYYQDDYDYIYSDNIQDLADLYDGYTYLIKTSDGTTLDHFVYEGKIRTLVSAGTPAYITFNTPEIYSITYELNGGEIDTEAPLYNYYMERSNLASNNEPLTHDAVFVGYYLDPEFTQTVYSSSFEPHDITLYAKWATKLYAPVYYYDSSLSTPDYVEVGTTYYYLDELNGYNIGYLPDTSKQIPYYFNEYGATSYKVYSQDGEELNAYNLDGFMYAQATKEIGYIRIYKHYSIKFYVNGNYVYEARGAESDTVEFPTFIEGYIGENYDAAHIGIIRIGKEYALYMMKGWSKTDSSDITWFDKTEVELVSDDITFQDVNDGEYVISLFGYMTYYGKLNSVNTDIDYDEYITSTNGIITTGSLYSLDDLMQEHVTEISSDSQKSNLDKFLKYFKLDNLGSGTLNLIKKLLNGDGISFSDIWNSALGKAILIIAALAALALAIINIFNFAKAMSKIQAKS